jgi:hypothetical protein
MTFMSLEIGYCIMGVTTLAAVYLLYWSTKGLFAKPLDEG